jgi:membrane-associated phospholipid phosphatase
MSVKSVAPGSGHIDRRTYRVVLGWAAALYCVAVVMAPLVWHKHGAGAADPMDRWGRDAIGAGLTHMLGGVHIGPTANGLFPHLVALGSPRDVAAMTALLALLCLATQELLGATLCAIGPLCAVLLTEACAKPVVDRVRNGAYQYPSGHCTAAAAVGTLGILLLSRHGGRRAVRTWGVLCVVPPGLVFVAMQRVGLHDLTEAIAGIVVGIATVLVATVALSALARRLPPRQGGGVVAGQGADPAAGQVPALRRAR